MGGERPRPSFMPPLVDDRLSRIFAAWEATRARVGVERIPVRDAKGGIERVIERIAEQE